MVEFVFVVVSQ